MRLSQMIINEEYKAGKFKVPIHVAVGHESVAVAVSEIMEEGDNLIPTHRNMAFNLARAGALRPLLDEYRLEQTGLNAAQSGSMNLLNPDRGIVYTSSILGNQFPVAVGFAMTVKHAGKKNVTIVMGGDGAIEEGSFYESMLMARSLKLPIIFLIENNEWSMATRIHERRCHIDLPLLSKAFDIRYVHLGGNDPYFYIDTLKELKKFSVENSTPVCVEVKVSTFGEWSMKTVEHPEGELVHYHMGPNLGVVLNEWPILKESDEDPIFALTKHFSREELEKNSRKQFAELQKEAA